MNIRRACLLIVSSWAVLCLSGCASIISGRNATVDIKSTPPDAKVVVRDKHGKEVVSTHTPASVQLKRQDRFLSPAKYTATIEKAGYESETVPIRSTVNPWILGNVAGGGLVGLVVDNTTGAAWKPKEKTIDKQLTPTKSGLSSDGNRDSAASTANNSSRD